MSRALAVIAGTPIDTQFGKKFLGKFTDKEIISFAISKTPDEQNLLQLNNPEKLFKICLDKCLEFKELGVEKVILYCSSLSSSLDLAELKKQSGMVIITPLDVYSSLEDKYQHILIIAATSPGTVTPERIIRQHHPKVKVTTIGYLSLVKQIEEQNRPEDIFFHTGLREILDFAHRVEVDLILLACTHFPYISQVVSQNTKIEVLDLDQGLSRFI